MPRETKEERELRRAAEAHAALIAKEEFKKTMPARLMVMQALAREICVSTRVDLTATGPSVTFSRYDHPNNCFEFEETITYDSEEWEVEHMERKLRELREERDARNARLAVAQEVFARLTPEERLAVKEFARNL
jgi:hypothetical protein